jgi:dienelactone hydrolase
MRQGDVSKIADIQEIISSGERGPDARVMSDPRRHSGVGREKRQGDTSRLGITGFAEAGIVWRMRAWPS